VPAHAGCALNKPSPSPFSLQKGEATCGVATYRMIRLTIDQHYARPSLLNFFLQFRGACSFSGEMIGRLLRAALLALAFNRRVGLDTTPLPKRLPAAFGITAT